MEKWPINKESTALGRHYNEYSIQAVANTSFGLGYVSGVHAMMIGTNTFDTVAGNPFSPPDVCVEPEDMTFEEAKNKIRQYFLDHHGEDIDYGDLIDALNIHLPLIVDVCDELESEGKIAEVN